MSKTSAWAYDVAVDLGLNADSLTEVSIEMELQNNERKDNTTEA